MALAAALRGGGNPPEEQPAGFAMPPEAITMPDEAQILTHLQRQVRRWHELNQPCWLEVRLLRDGFDPLNLHYNPFAKGGLEAAASDIAYWNAKERNAYTVRNPVADTRQGAAKDKDIIAAFAAFADCDDDIAAQNVREFVGPKYTYAVTTGTIPGLRPHVYWELTEPVTDLKAWTALQMNIAAALKSDAKVVNPSRIMRVAGTLTWPDQKKIDRGYVQELVSIRTDYPDADQRQPVPFEQLQRAFPRTVAQSTGATIDLGPEALDREEVRQAALSGTEWHNNMIRLVASHVARGLSDEEIHRLTDDLTLDGYTVEDTRRDVQQAIRGARNKGWTPEAQPPPLETKPGGNPDDPQPTAAETPVIPFVPWAQMNLATIPRTRFVYNDFYARGYTSLTIAAPKVGKSTLALMEAVDMVTGHGQISGKDCDPLRVIYFNAEDDQNVINNRVAAIIQKYEIDQSALAGRLFATSGVDWDGFFLSYGDPGAINEPLFTGLEQFVRDNQIDVLMMDPLQDMTTAPETNDAFRLLGRRLRRLAADTDIAIGIVHHTRKMAPGMAPSIDDARGGSALRGTCRFNRILAPMTEDEAEKAGVDNHRWYLRIGDIESNLAPPSADVNQWFRKVSVETPNGEHAGAIERWNWPDPFNGMKKADALRVKAEIDRMETPPRYDIRSRDWAGEIICNVLGLNPAEKRDRSRAQHILKAWIATDVLRLASERDNRTGRDINIVVCGDVEPGGQAG